MEKKDINIDGLESNYDYDTIKYSDKYVKLRATSLELSDILKTEQLEKIGNFIEEDIAVESDLIKEKNCVQDDSPWYEEEDINLEHMYKINDAKQMELEISNMTMDFHYNKTEPKSEIIGDFVKNEYPVTKDINVGANIDMSKLKRLFGSSEILEMQKNLELNRIESESDKESNNELESVCCRATETEIPIIPDYDIDYDNIFENIEKVGEIEKNLQLLYRPFTCLVDVNCRFSLFELAILLDNSRYDPAHHPALTLRLRNPSAEAKIYAGGKITSTALTADSARNAILKVIHMVEELDYKTDITVFSKNIVHASFCLPFKIDLEMLSELHSDHVSGNREVRPFITYKIEGTTMRFAVFPNGFILVLHSKQHSETRAAIAAFLPILVQFKNGYLTHTEKYGSLCGDVSFRILWERKLEEDSEGILLYS
ncbi:uncharacterized protein LOC117782333 [Drosophila innubila]|uniref:uncharacterized protein LOC117782333 n=1 Tax=Drosophila innubila TaxID=198719 RepID=UPI00148BB7C4|nr:uncharacterized protein LOC117782333 [Drosophila innubila]